MKIAAKVGTAIREHRKRSGLTMSELAERAEIDPGFLAYIESGKKTPSLHTVSKLSGALGVPMSDLFGGVSRSPDGVKAALHRATQTLCLNCTRGQVADLLAVLRILHDPRKVKALRALLD